MKERNKNDIIKKESDKNNFNFNRVSRDRTKIFNHRYFQFTHHDYIASGYKTSDRDAVLIIPQRILNNNSILSACINRPSPYA